MNNINQRLLEIRQELDLSQTKFGYYLGVSRSVITNLEGDKTTASSEFLDLVCRIYNVNKDWLLYGTGKDKFVKESQIDKITQQYNLSDKEVTILENYLNMDNDKRQVFVDMLLELANTANMTKSIEEENNDSQPKPSTPQTLTTDKPRNQPIAADTGRRFT